MAYVPIQNFPAGGAWRIIGKHEALVPESSFIFSFLAIDFDDDSQLVLVMDGSITAPLVIQLRINNNATANYFFDGRTIAGGIEIIIDGNVQTQMEISNTTLHSNVNEQFHGNVLIYLAKSGSLKVPTMQALMVGERGSQVMMGKINANTPSITDVEVRTSTSTWQTGTRMTLYRVKRD